MDKVKAHHSVVAGIFGTHCIEAETLYCFPFYNLTVDDREPGAYDPSPQHACKPEEI